ncbi:MAG: TolC family protein [Candidatus Latescibacteria bacterium]|nr:TolC family protein [Candidatus Latescibacterota bacterium]
MFAQQTLIVLWVSLLCLHRVDAQTYDLKTSVARALEIHPGVQAAQVDIAIAESQLDQAMAARFLPKLDVRSVLGPSPEARGNALAGDTNLSDLQIFSQTEATFVQPLFTFGKLNGVRDAASAGVLAYEAGLSKSKADLELQVFEVFYGVHLANLLWRLAQEAQADFRTARNYVAQKLEEDEGDFTYIDLNRIDRFAFDVTEQVNAANKAQALAASAMRLLLGLGASDSLALSGELEPIDVEVLPLDAYLSRGDSRAEMSQLKAALTARKSLIQVAKSDQYPQLFLAGQFKYAYAPNRDDQKSPFAHDPLNLLYAGAVVGFQQSLSFGLSSAKVKKARLEHQKLVYQAHLAQKGVSIEIEKIYRELKEAESNLAAVKKARKATRRWFIAVRDGFNGGFEKASDMIDAVKEYGIIRAKYFEAVYNFNRSWAKLQRATGQPIVQSLGL